MDEYDYSSPGAYFITFCTHDKAHTLSRIVGAIHESPRRKSPWGKSPEPQLTACGRAVESVLQSIPEHLLVTVDRYIIMPNHIHLIAVITEEQAQRAIRESPLRCRSLISRLVGYIKMNASKIIRQQYGNVAVWQRGYHDHIIRNQQDYQMLAKYLEENPLRWILGQDTH